jgi:hypothetical protein
MPAVLVNLANNGKLGETKKERLSKAVTMGLPFIARVLEKQQMRLERGLADPQIPLNFNKMAGIAKSAPELLEKEFSINRDGLVSN